jgi:hypothetical protein
VLNHNWKWVDRQIQAANSQAANDYGTLQRRFRASEVYDKALSEGNYDIALKHIGKYQVVLDSDGVSCTCEDFVNRRQPCKHIFAMAAILGDQEALLKQAPPPPLMQDESATIGKSSQSPEGKKWRGDDRPQNVRVGKYFMLSDFLYSQTAVEKGIRNCPPLAGREIDSLYGLCAAILDPVVEQFGPLSITYGYSCPELHAAIYSGRSMPLGLHNCHPPGGAMLGIAADILVHSMADRPREMLSWIVNNCVHDRLILYPGSNICCVAWSDRPRYHAKEWIFDTNNQRKYIDLRQV